jgi:hypothetical protein
MVSLLSNVMRGFTGYEAAQQIRLINQRSLYSMAHNLNNCKRIFSNDPVGNSILGRVKPYIINLQVQANGLIYPGATFSRLPAIVESALYTNALSSTAVGNCLFFAAYDRDFVSSAVVTSNGIVPMRISTYRFYLYYLTPENPSGIRGVSTYRLILWRSLRFADYTQLKTLGWTAGMSALNQLCDDGVEGAWDSEETDVDHMFYELRRTGGGYVLHSDYSIQCADDLPCPVVLTKTLTGVTGGGFRYGISPNSNSWAQAPKTVPSYTQPNGQFPGGFEVLIAGPQTSRQIRIRSVLVAQGNMPNIIGDELSTTVNSPDVW